MRVLHVGKYFPPFAGGMECFLADLLHALTEQGVAVAALVHREHAGGRGVRPAATAAIPIYRAPSYGRLLHTPVSPAFPFWLAEAIRDFRPDLLHLHLPNPSAFAALWLPSARRLPWAIHWHADVVASAIDRRLALAYRVYRPFEQRLLAQSRVVLATSPPYLESSAALQPWRARCRTVPLGLPATRLPAPESEAQAWAETQWSDAALRVLAIGRLTYYKGHDTLIRAAADVPDARFLIVGAGDRRARLLALIRSQGLDARVRLPGLLPDAMRNALLASCDLLCLPSLERSEAFGLVLLEAMRFGKPVIASDISGSGVGWVVRQAGHGLLTPPGDPTRLARALRTLQRDPERRRRLGQSGAIALRERFGMTAIAQDIAAIYAELGSPAD